MITGVLVYTLGEAARAVGKTRPALAKAIKTGRLSAVRGEDGSYQIDDPAELHRVYPVASQLDGSGLQKFPLAVTAETAAGLREELAKWHALAEEREETIRDLRTRLDASKAERRHEGEEHRRAQERLTAPLTHRQAGSVPAVQRTASEPRAPWWRRWFR